VLLDIDSSVKEKSYTVLVLKNQVDSPKVENGSKKFFDYLSMGSTIPIFENCLAAGHEVCKQKVLFLVQTLKKSLSLFLVVENKGRLSSGHHDKGSKSRRRKSDK